MSETANTPHETQQECETVPQPIVLLDNEWTTQGDTIFQILSANQSGNGDAGGQHYLKIDNDRVSANGMSDQKSTLFKVFTSMESSSSPYVLLMLECVGGPYRNHMVAIVNGRLSFIEKQHDYEKVSDAEPEVLFRKLLTRASSSKFALQLVANGRQFIGFDESGKALPPTLVNPESSEGMFFVWPYRKHR